MKNYKLHWNINVKRRHLRPELNLCNVSNNKCVYLRCQLKVQNPDLWVPPQRVGGAYSVVVSGEMFQSSDRFFGPELKLAYFEPEDQFSFHSPGTPPSSRRGHPNNTTHVHR